jgi:hypothetical protein
MVVSQVELGVQESLAGRGTAGGKSRVLKLKKVLEYGMKRELLLLSRPPDEARFKVIARDDFERGVWPDEVRFKAAVQGKTDLQEALTQLRGMLSSSWDPNSSPL